MTTIFGTFYWTGHLPDDDDVASAPQPVFSGDYGEQWQFMATKPVIQSLCDSLRMNESISDVCDPNPEDHGWYTYFKRNGWTWFLYVKWVPDGDRVNCFEFDVRLCNLWWHRMIHWSTYGSQCQAVRTVLESTLPTTNQVEGVVFGRRGA